MSKPNNKSKPSHKFDIGGDFGISGTLQFVNGLTSNSKERKANEETYNNAIDNTRIGFNSISSLNNLDSLEDYINSSGQLHELETSDLIGNNAHRIGKFLSTSSQAMQAGSNFGLWSALAGAVVGQIGAGIAGRRNRKKAESAVANLNEKIRQTNALQTAMVDNKLNNIMANQIADQQWDYIAALGGNLHSNSTTWSNGLNYIGSGGSHESNPNDGVAISTAPDGLQNKVEEGEVVWNDDYVFSRRLKVPKKDLEKNKWKGETYADIAKKLMDESAERPNDPITLRGLDDSLSRLRDSQEELKAKQEGNKIKKEIASMPPELLAQMQQAQQQPTKEEIMQQQAMEQIPQEQIAMVDPSMQQPMMEQPPMYAKGGHLFPNGGVYAWSLYDKFNKPNFNQSLQYGSNLNTSIGQNIQNQNDFSIGKNIAANSNGINNHTLGVELNGNKTTTDTSKSGMNKGALFSGIASGIDMIGAGFQSAGYRGGDLNALYKGTKHNNMFGDNMHKAMNGYLNIGLMPSMFAKGGHLHTDGGKYESYIHDYLNNLDNEERVRLFLKQYGNEFNADAFNDPLVIEKSLSDLTKNRKLTKEDKRIIKEYKQSQKAERQIQKETENKIASKEHPLKLNAFDWDGTTLRYAPVWGSIFNLARSIADRPDYGNPERIERAAARVGTQISPRYIDEYVERNPLDETYYLNQLNAQQNAANNAIVGLSNGNRSMALASMLANDYNYNNQRGAAYRQGVEYNRADDLRRAEFNRGTKQFNAQQYMQAAAQNASNRAQAANLISAAAQMREGIDNAYGASQSANWTNLFNNIGNVGRDEMNRNMTKDLYDYYIGRNGMTGFKGTNAKRGGYLTIKTNNRRKE